MTLQDTSLPIVFGPFKIIEAPNSLTNQNDYVLTDTNENVYFGFQESEAADLQIVANTLMENITPPEDTKQHNNH